MNLAAPSNDEARNVASIRRRMTRQSGRSMREWNSDAVILLAIESAYDSLPSRQSSEV